MKTEVKTDVEEKRLKGTKKCGDSVDGERRYSVEATRDSKGKEYPTASINSEFDTLSPYVKGMRREAKGDFPDIPGLTAEADAEIRRVLREMASVPAVNILQETIAPKLVAAYGKDIQAVRGQKHGWRKIVKIFRAHGLKIGEKSLKARLEA